MLHLMDVGFERTRILFDTETGEAVPSIDDVCENEVVVGKYPRRTETLEFFLTQEDLGIIYMMRDPRDVLVSRHFMQPQKYWVSPQRWIDTAHMAEEVKDYPQVIVVKFEDLIEVSDEVQLEIARVFDLEMSVPFEECHKKFNQTDKVGISAMNGARSLDTSRIGNWKEDEAKRARVQWAFTRCPEIKELMQKFDYQP